MPSFFEFTQCCHFDTKYSRVCFGDRDAIILMDDGGHCPEGEIFARARERRVDPFLEDASYVAREVEHNQGVHQAQLAGEGGVGLQAGRYF